MVFYPTGVIISRIAIFNSRNATKYEKYMLNMRNNTKYENIH